MSAAVHAEPPAGFLQADSGFDAFGPAHVALRATHYELRAFSDALYRHYGIEQPPGIRRAVAKRRAEFLAGRLCVADAMAALGVNPAPVAIGAQRAPAWPHGLVGSISHAEGLALAAVARNDQVHALGIDCERLLCAATVAEVSASVLRAEERRWAATLAPCARQRFVTLVFSAKESLFKALYPSVNAYFDCQDAEVFAVDADRFQVRLARTLNAGWRQGQCFTGRYRTCGQHMATLLVVSAV